MKVDKTTYERINILVKEGKYPSIESFVELAVRNQLLLEGEEKPQSGRSRSGQYGAKIEEPSLSLPLKRPKTIISPTFEENMSRVPLWGQVNRLAPAKFVLRILLNDLASSDEDTVDLKRFSAEVAEKATEFRLFAKRRDKKKRVRGEFLYVGFPKKDPISQQRFLNYYVGKAPLQKWTDSVLLGLSFVNIVDAEDGSRVIGLTETGLKFALLGSPLVDEFFTKGEQISSPFSIEEVSLLISQIKSVRLGEFEFMRFILASVKNGADTPTRLKSMVFEFLRGKDLEVKLSEKVANTMQVGVIGRLVEMGVLKIEKEAQKSKYRLAEKVEELVGKL